MPCLGPCPVQCLSLSVNYSLQNDQSLAGQSGLPTNTGFDATLSPLGGPSLPTTGPQELNLSQRKAKACLAKFSLGVGWLRVLQFQYGIAFCCLSAGKHRKSSVWKQTPSRGGEAVMTSQPCCAPIFILPAPQPCPPMLHAWPHSRFTSTLAGERPTLSFSLPPL